MAPQDWSILLRDVFTVLTWIVAVIYLVSGLQDLRYDLFSYALRAIRRVRFRDRERLTKARLRMREQQWIAVMVPAWAEGEVIGEMVKNILDRVEYTKYKVFVGVYPNDPETNQALDRITATRSEVIKVVTARPGPTNKADCLNNVLQAIEAYEVQHGINFDIIAMHDAEDVVNPYGFLVYNYLIPRVDVVQLPILPLPTKLNRWVHWIYADEFCENHMKDVPARELMTGFVPYAGVGTGFSRRVIHFLKDLHHGQVFNESSLTEDYSMSKKILESGYKSVFVNVLLADDDSPWWTPLCKRSAFVSNWSFFPMDYKRSVRQKSRWILGISIQEWVMTGWSGGWRIRENLAKDRKVFVAMSATILGYLVFFYVVASWIHQAGWIPLEILPVVTPGTNLFTILLVVMGMTVYRVLQKTVFVSMVYGVAAGLGAGPRMLLANILNGHASILALKAFSDSQRGRKQMKWAKTDHVEGLGALPTAGDQDPGAAQHEETDLDDLIVKLNSNRRDPILFALKRLTPDIPDDKRDAIAMPLTWLAGHEDSIIRAEVANAIGVLGWWELQPRLRDLLFDRDWPVRANAVSALLDQPNFPDLLEWILLSKDAYAIEVLVKMIEQDLPKMRALLAYVASPRHRSMLAALERRSKVFEKMLADDERETRAA